MNGHNYFGGLVLMTGAVAIISSPMLAVEGRCQQQVQRREYPVLCHFLDRVADDPMQLALELTEFSREMGFLVQPVGAAAAAAAVVNLTSDIINTTTVTSEMERNLRSVADKRDTVPIVLAHGMGDSCFNSGMQSLTHYASQLLDNTYGACIPTGDTQHEDTINGYFKSMNDNVDIFATKVKADSNLANGFYAIGLSQGNNVIRGYITKYNDPPVKAFISINGVNGGTGVLPNCLPIKGDPGRICSLLEEQASKRAYTDYYQEHSFQAGYWRDPRPSQKELYQTYSQLAQWNNEGLIFNETYKENWAKTDKFVWIKADRDSMVWPSEGEWFGAPDPNDPFHKILTTKETEWYKKDLFGLKTAEEAGKNFYESFDDDHLHFTDDMFKDWVTTYLK